MRFTMLAAASFFALAACGQPSRSAPAPEGPPQISMTEQVRSEMQRVNTARLTVAMPETMTERPAPAAAEGSTPAATAPRYDAGLVRVQTLLDRAHFSPGVIDGFDGENVRKAIAAYQRANDLPETGRADDALLARLEQADASPALVPYVLTEADVSGPFVDVPTEMEAQASLARVGYESAPEALAEQFHMDADLLQTLNPGVDFSRAGVEIVVANAGGELSAQVARIEIDKAALTLRAYDAADRMLAFYPVTIGAGNTPSGELEVTGIAFDPTYNYDADELPAFNDNSGRRFTIQPGPNNPVGLVWIALNSDGYGLHGTPNPSLISKSSSRGCVRLTNWDAVELGRAVQAGVPVNFNAGGDQARRATSRG
ncbi:MAG: murein L,D-transpeptidase [Phycisphaerales bacterium]|nr:murein L,D-transpeptidase [Hyphomonadaceae bacterium]